VERFFTPLLRRLYWFLAGFLVIYFAVYVVQHSTWNKERQFRRLMNGNQHQQADAAANLVELGGQVQLVRALHADSETVATLAAQSLWDLWFRAAGDKAYRVVLGAQQLMDGKRFGEALLILNHVTREYPRYAEGWNRRATLYWLSGDYHKSIADCRKALTLNPDHFGAWQGMAMCQFHLGEITAGCRSLRCALKINPHDATSRRLLRWGEDWLRRSPREEQSKKYELVRMEQLGEACL
jgi:tetratricopeptide (TPR) repeat protein